MVPHGVLGLRYPIADLGNFVQGLETTRAGWRTRKSPLRRLYGNLPLEPKVKDSPFGIGIGVDIGNRFSIYDSDSDSEIRAYLESDRSF